MIEDDDSQVISSLSEEDALIGSYMGLLKDAKDELFRAIKAEEPDEKAVISRGSYLSGVVDAGYLLLVRNRWVCSASWDSEVYRSKIGEEDIEDDDGIG